MYRRIGKVQSWPLTSCASRRPKCPVVVITVVARSGEISRFCMHRRERAGLAGLRYKQDTMYAALKAPLFHGSQGFRTSPPNRISGTARKAALKTTSLIKVFLPATEKACSDRNIVQTSSPWGDLIFHLSIRLPGHLNSLAEKNKGTDDQPPHLPQN